MVKSTKTGEKLGTLKGADLSHFELKKLASLVAGQDCGCGDCGAVVNIIF